MIGATGGGLLTGLVTTGVMEVAVSGVHSQRIPSVVCGWIAVFVFTALCHVTVCGLLQSTAQLFSSSPPTVGNYTKGMFATQNIHLSANNAHISSM